MTEESARPSDAVLGLVAGAWTARALAVAAGLGVADVLATGPQGAAELAAATGTHARSLYRLLRTLASHGVFSEDAEGRFHLTPIGQCLRSDAPDSMRAFAQFWAEGPVWEAWGALDHSVATGEPAFKQVFGIDLFPYLAQHPEEAALFNASMVNRTAQEEAGIVASYDFSGSPEIVDVGGGRGSLLASILEAAPTSRGVLFELPHVAAEAEAYLGARGLRDRCRVMGGSFFDQVPAGGDVYVLKKVIHNWDDERAAQILRVCRRAMPDHARLLLLEILIPPGNAPFFGKDLDALMMVMLGSQERTEAEYQMLLAGAGLALTRVMPTASLVSVIESKPAGSSDDGRCELLHNVRRFDEARLRDQLEDSPGAGADHLPVGLAAGD